jgi:hypothetical protein
MEIHFLNKGALFSSHPVTPPKSKIGDRAVPTPKSKAKAKLSNEVVNAAEYVTKRNNKGGHTISPLLNPREKACKSNLAFNLPKAELSILELVQPSHDRGFDLALKSIFAPITIVTNANATEEYLWNEDKISLSIIDLKRPIAPPIIA